MFIVLLEFSSHRGTPSKADERLQFLQVQAP
jgi:hypothetical protein